MLPQRLFTANQTWNETETQDTCKNAVLSTRVFSRLPLGSLQRELAPNNIAPNNRDIV